MDVGETRYGCGGTWAAEDQLRGNWMAGKLLKSGWSEWEESATDRSFMSQVKSAATQTFDGKAFAQNMAAMLTGSEQNKLWRSFTRSVLSMMTEISFLLKQAMVGIVGSIGKACAIGGAVGGGASASGKLGTAIQAAAAKFHFATSFGGFTGTGGKYEPAGKAFVHRGEFVFTKEATSKLRIGVGNLYRLMRGYASFTGGYVGTPGSMADSQAWSQASGTFEQNNHVVKLINNDGTNGQIGPAALSLKAVYDMARKGARDEKAFQTQMRDGGLFSGGGKLR